MLETLRVKIKIKKARKYCYKANKEVGLAAQGVCRGHHSDGIPSLVCVTYPYLTDNFTTEER